MKIGQRRRVLSADLPPVSSIPPLPEFATVDQQRDDQEGSQGAGFHN